MSYTAFRRAIDDNLITMQFQNGVQKIIFPSDNAIDNRFVGDTATATRVKEAVKGVKNLFTPQLIKPSDV